jgi:hypothetical protein
MFSSIRNLVAALAVGLLILSHVAPAAATSRTDDFTRVHEIPVLLDAMFLRPVGLLMTGVGMALATLPMGMTLMTRPTDVYKPFTILVVNPARFTFVDPLGQH